MTWLVLSMILVLILVFVLMWLLRKIRRLKSLNISDFLGRTWLTCCAQSC